MGMYDEVWFDEELRSFALRCRRFQTKSLERCLDRYMVTKEGRLCLVGNTLMQDSATPGSPEKVDTDFHGDIRLVSDDENHDVYIARFTHGTLEWIRPAAEISPVVLTR
jgi:hypothetical protein